MPKTIIAALAGALTLLLAQLVPAMAAAQSFSPQQEQAIELILRDYLLENPEVLRDALTILQQRESAAEQEAQRLAVTDRLDQLQNSPTSPITGNPEGDVTLVEFFDYQCGYCKSIHSHVFDVAEADDRVKVVMKEIPILGPVSNTAARAALAAGEQDKYFEMHDALMTHRGRLTDDAVFDIAADQGLDVDQLRADMDSETVGAEIAANLQLAQDIGVRGTPAFVVNGEVIPGAVPLDALMDMVRKAHGS